MNTNKENGFTNFKTSGDIFTNEYTRDAAYLSAGACKQATDLVC